MQCSAAAAGTANSIVQGATANSSRDERSTARQTAEAANSILVDGVVVQPAYRSTPWEAEAKHAATATDKVCSGVWVDLTCHVTCFKAIYSRASKHSRWMQAQSTCQVIRQALRCSSCKTISRTVSCIDASLEQGSVLKPTLLLAGLLHGCPANLLEQQMYCILSCVAGCHHVCE